MAIYKLGEISFITKLSGFEYSKYFKSKTTTGDIPLIQASDISNNSLNFEKVFWITNDLSTSLMRSKPKKNDILFSYVGTVGNNYLVKNENLHLGSNVALIRPLLIIKPKFLYYFLNSFVFKKELNKYIKGTNQLNIKMADIRLIKIDLPSISEQQEIIDIIKPFEFMEAKLKKIKSKLKILLILLYKNLNNKTEIPFNSLIEIINTHYEGQKYYFATNAVKELEIEYNKVISIDKIKPSRAEVSPVSNSFIFSKLDNENKIFYFKEKPKEVFSTGFYNFKTKYNDHVLGFILSDSFKFQKQQLSTGTTMRGINNLSLKLINLKQTKNKSDTISNILFDLEQTLQSMKQIKSKLINLLIK